MNSRAKRCLLAGEVSGILVAHGERAVAVIGDRQSFAALARRLVRDDAGQRESRRRQRVDGGLPAVRGRLREVVDEEVVAALVPVRQPRERFGEPCGVVHRGGAGDKRVAQRLGDAGEPDESFVVPAEDGSHGGAEPKLIAEFLRFVRDGGLTETSPVAAREAVATGVLAAESLRDGSAPRVVPPVPGDLEAYFVRGQRR